jgi:uncharacterized protein (TIGR02391 family)
LPSPLLSIFPKPADLLALEPEELGGAILEITPSLGARFTIDHLAGQLFGIEQDKYPHTQQQPVVMALAEALSWLVSQGLLVIDPTQPALWYVVTRRARSLKSRADVEAYRKGRILPAELLQPELLRKVRPLFIRGDHDVAVFQAFKEVEVAVRNAANAKGAGYPDDLVGVTLMRRAFHPDNGPLTDKDQVTAEREAEMHLFSGAIGHAKNPTSHRDVGIAPQEAARLIVFAAYLLSIVEER